MTADELRAWALGQGWTVIDGHPSLTKPQMANRTGKPEAVVRMVLKATVVAIEAKKPAGKWEKISGAAYPKVVADEEGVPTGLGMETIPGFRMLMQENRDRAVFRAHGGGRGHVTRSSRALAGRLRCHVRAAEPGSLRKGSR